MPGSELDNGIGLLSLMVQAELASSNSEARRSVKGGAVKVNDQPVSDEKMVVDTSYMSNDGAIKLSFGKKRHVLVRKG